MRELNALRNELRSQGKESEAQQIYNLIWVAGMAQDYLSVVSEIRKEAREWPEASAYDLLNQPNVTLCEAFLRQWLKEAKGEEQ